MQYTDENRKSQLEDISNVLGRESKQPNKERGRYQCGEVKVITTRKGRPLGGDTEKAKKGKARVWGEMKKSEAWRRLKPGPAKTLDTMWEVADGPYATADGEYFVGVRLKVPTIAEKVGTGESTVRRHLNALQRAGFIEKIQTGRSLCITILPTLGIVSDRSSKTAPDDESSDQIDQELAGRSHESERSDSSKVSDPHTTTNNHQQRPPPQHQQGLPAAYESPSPAAHQRTGDVVVAAVFPLLMERGVSESVACELARAPVEDAVGHIAAFDAGTLKGPGGLVSAFQNRWGHGAEPGIYEIDLDDGQVDMLEARMREWVDEIVSREDSEAVQEKVIADARAVCGLDEDGDLDTTLMVKAYLVYKAAGWWVSLDEESRRSRRALIECLTLKCGDYVGEGASFTSLAAYLIEHGLAKLGRSDADEYERSKNLFGRSGLLSMLLMSSHRRQLRSTIQKVKDGIYTPSLSGS